MSRFLHNLIIRHQPADAGENAGHFVQPRPKSRFENDTGAGSSMSMSDSVDSIMTSADSKTLTAGDNNSRPDRAASGKSDPATGLYPNDLAESIGIPPPFARQDKDHQDNTKPARTALNAEHSINHHTSIAHATDPGLQTARQDLNRVHDQSGDNPPFTENPPGRRSSDATTGDNSDLAGRYVEKLVMTGQTPGTDHADSLENNSPGNRPGQPETGQSGILQSPPWLNDMWSDFANRYREIKTRSDSRPEVNVSIGSVVIKAIQTEPEKPVNTTKDQDRPGGIMSLDDYLKQRDARWS